MMERIRFDFGNLMRSSVECGVTELGFHETLAEEFRRAHAIFTERREIGDLGFLDLPYASETVESVTQITDALVQRFEDVVVLGIGGSALGAMALKEALLGPLWNVKTDEERDHSPRLHVVDNPDPHTFQTLLSRLTPPRTLFNVVSKSGETAETMSQYLVARDWVERSVDQSEISCHFIFTTGPLGGVLRQIGDAEGVPMLPVPQNVGGGSRFYLLLGSSLLQCAV